MVRILDKHEKNMEKKDDLHAEERREWRESADAAEKVRAEQNERSIAVTEALRDTIIRIDERSRNQSPPDNRGPNVSMSVGTKDEAAGVSYSVRRKPRVPRP